MRVAPISRRCAPVAEWPAQDQRAWCRALLPEDPFDPQVGRASHYRASTHRIIEEGYGRWIGWLSFTGRLNWNLMPGERADRATLSAYQEALAANDLADYSIAARLQQLSQALRSMEPKQDWYWLERAAGRIRNHAIPRRDQQSLIQPVDSLVNLGLKLIADADSGAIQLDLDRAMAARDGLIIAFLALRPIRRKNLTSLTLDRHLVQRDGRWNVQFRGDETKNSEPMKFSWPELLVAPLERYLAVHRKTLLERREGGILDTRRLWISRYGGSLGDSAIYVRVGRLTGEHLGVAINLHSFRHIAATTIATADPKGAMDIKAVLGHTSMQSSDKYYNRAQLVGASMAYQRTLSDIRNGCSKWNQKLR